MLKINELLWVSAGQVAKIEVSEHMDKVYVTLKNGVKHSIYPDYRKSAFSTADRLVSEVDAELRREEG